MTGAVTVPPRTEQWKDCIKSGLADRSDSPVLRQDFYVPHHEDAQWLTKHWHSKLSMVFQSEAFHMNVFKEGLQQNGS